jgi:hypothetical protein
VSVEVCRTSVGLSAAVRSFLVEFDYWFGESPTDSPAGKSVRLTSLMNMHQKVTGKSPDNSSHSRAKKLVFWIGRVRQSPTGKGGGSVKTSIKLVKVTRLRIEPRTFWTYTKCSNQLSYLAIPWRTSFSMIPQIIRGEQPCAQISISDSPCRPYVNLVTA